MSMTPQNLLTRLIRKQSESDNDRAPLTCVVGGHGKKCVCFQRYDVHRICHLQRSAQSRCTRRGEAQQLLPIGARKRQRRSRGHQAIRLAHVCRDAQLKS